MYLSKKTSSLLPIILLFLFKHSVAQNDMKVHYMIAKVQPGIMYSDDSTEIIDYNNEYQVVLKNDKT
jgi:hypothetical protein